MDAKNAKVTHTLGADTVPLKKPCPAHLADKLVAACPALRVAVVAAAAVPNLPPVPVAVAVVVVKTVRPAIKVKVLFTAARIV